MQKKTINSSVSGTPVNCEVSCCDDNLLETYFKQIRAFPLLTFEEELELSKQIQKGNLQAFHKLINSNLRLVIKIAKLFNKYNIPILDIIQEGNVGLIHAAEKYDHKKNVRFCTYASYWIKQFIARFIFNKRRMVRLPMRKEEMLRKIQNAYHILCQSMMHQPGNSDIAKELGLPVKDIDNIINMAAATTVYETNYADDESLNIIDVHEDYTYCPERDLMKQFSQDNTLNVLKNLKEREKRIISYRFQLDGCEYHTLREIGDKFDISPETVRQIEKRALKKIKSRAHEIRENLYTEAI